MTTLTFRIHSPCLPSTWEGSLDDLLAMEQDLSATTIASIRFLPVGGSLSVKGEEETFLVERIA